MPAGVAADCAAVSTTPAALITAIVNGVVAPPEVADASAPHPITARNAPLLDRFIPPWEEDVCPVMGLNAGFSAAASAAVEGRAIVCTTFPHVAVATEISSKNMGSWPAYEPDAAGPNRRPTTLPGVKGAAEAGAVTSAIRRMGVSEMNGGMADADQTARQDKRGWEGGGGVELRFSACGRRIPAQDSNKGTTTSASRRPTASRRANHNGRHKLGNKTNYCVAQRTPTRTAARPGGCGKRLSFIGGCGALVCSTLHQHTSRIDGRDY